MGIPVGALHLHRRSQDVHGLRRFGAEVELDVRAWRTAPPHRGLPPAEDVTQRRLCDRLNTAVRVCPWAVLIDRYTASGAQHPLTDRLALRR
jgi:hypothetical protein